MSNRWQKLENIKKFEIELSSHCNARCPLCIRQLLGTDQERPGFRKGHLTLKQMESFIKQIPDPSKVVLYMAGVGGDPMMNPEAVEIFNVFIPSPPVPQVSTQSLTFTLLDLFLKTCTPPAISSATSPFADSNVKKSNIAKCLFDICKFGHPFFICQKMSESFYPFFMENYQFRSHLIKF